MRLWHKDLIPVLPRNQLVGQWRECCALAKGIAETGKTNHILINRIMEYSPEHFYRYCGRVFAYMLGRGYSVNQNTLLRYCEDVDCMNAFWNAGTIPIDELFFDWHNDRYLRQCYYNLEEKYDCGGISEKEFARIKTVYNPSRDG